MKKNSFYLLIFVLMGLVISCGETTTTDTAADTTTVTETTATNDLSTVEGLDKWVAAITANNALTRTEHEFNCEGWGGTVTYVKENNEIRVLENLEGGDDGAALAKFYYNNNQLVYVLFETSMWAGDDNTTSQKIYYIKDGAAFKALKKEAKSTGQDQIIGNLAKVAFTETTFDDFASINTAATELKGIAPDKIQDFFCK